MTWSDVWTPTFPQADRGGQTGGGGLEQEKNERLSGRPRLRCMLGAARAGLGRREEAPERLSVVEKSGTILQ